MITFFINYRTGDESFAAVALDNALADRIGKENVFRDSRSIPPGTDFEPTLWLNLARSTALIVVIGPRWLSGKGELNRMQDPADFVRREIEFAFQLGLPIVPVLVGGVPMPNKDDLPPSVKKLVKQQYLRIDARTAETVQFIAGKIVTTFGGTAARQPTADRSASDDGLSELELHTLSRLLPPGAPITGSVLNDAGLPQHRRPAVAPGMNGYDYWLVVNQAIVDGVLADGRDRILRAAAAVFPFNEVLLEARDR